MTIIIIMYIVIFVLLFRMRSSSCCWMSNKTNLATAENHFDSVVVV